MKTNGELVLGSSQLSAFFFFIKEIGIRMCDISKNKESVMNNYVKERKVF